MESDMTLEDLFTEWNKDSDIDKSQLDIEALRIPKLHNKYMKYYVMEKLSLTKLRSEYNTLKRKLIEYYRGELTKVELEELGRPQYLNNPSSREIEILVDTDSLLIPHTLKFAAQTEKVDYIKGVIDAINARGYQIKNAIDFMRWTQGI